MKLLGNLAAAVLASSAAYAGPADVVDAKLSKNADGTYQFHVTVQHADEGWDHYADAWEVLGPQGELLAKRVLAHPHVQEQPFTRSLTSVSIPNDILQVELRAHDSVHGYSGQRLLIKLPD